MAVGNPLIEDRLVEFLLYEVLEVGALCELPYYQDHNREIFDLFIGNCRKLAREVLFPAYRPMDERPAHFEDGKILCHPLMKQLHPQIAELGLFEAMRSYEAGGQQLPNVISSVASSYLGTANGSAMAYSGLTAGAAHLIETFGSDELKHLYMEPMHAGRWTGTMALTEPQAGSGLMDVQTKATPTPDGHHLIKGSKVFISGGDNDFTENIVHLVLARIEDAPAGTKGISLFVVPKKRVEGDTLVNNDVTTAGAFHKHGWRGVPAAALSFGDEGSCRGYLVGQPHHGLKYMFQMMNEARLGVGSSATGSAMAAYHEALEYAKNRPQGRKLGNKASKAPVMIIEHADVRRMLLRQKAIVEGAFSLITTCAYFSDLAAHGSDDNQRSHYSQLLDLLTPVAKTFPSEKGYESNTLAVQIHGGYGYTSEYLPEAWLRDQKLNSIHEGTTGIQSLDLLGRKMLGTGGAALVAFSTEVTSALRHAEQAHLPSRWCDVMRGSLELLQACTAHVGALSVQDPDKGMQNSVDYLDMFCTIVIGWQWLVLANVAKERLAKETTTTPSTTFYEGKLRAAQYWFENEMPRVRYLADVIRTSDDSFLRASGDHF